MRSIECDEPDQALKLDPVEVETFEALMRACESGWRRGNSLAAAAAISVTRAYRQPLDREWIVQAVHKLVAEVVKDSAKGQTQH